MTDADTGVDQPASETRKAADEMVAPTLLPYAPELIRRGDLVKIALVPAFYCAGRLAWYGFLALAEPSRLEPFTTEGSAALLALYFGGALVLTWAAFRVARAILAAGTVAFIFFVVAGFIAYDLGQFLHGQGRYLLMTSVFMGLAAAEALLSANKIASIDNIGSQNRASKFIGPEIFLSVGTAIVLSIGLGSYFINARTQQVTTNIEPQSPNADIAAPQTAEILPLCDSQMTRGAVQNAVEENALQNIAFLRLLDIQNVREIKTNENQRLCSGMLILNSGPVFTRFIVSLSSRGDTLVLVGDGLDIDVNSSNEAASADAQNPPLVLAPSESYSPPPSEDLSIAGYPLALRRWRDAVKNAGFDYEWLTELNGTGSATRVLVEGRPYVRLFSCQSHFCSDSNATLLLSEDQTRVTGFIEHTAEGAESPQRHWILTPNSAEAACLAVFNPTSGAACP